MGLCGGLHRMVEQLHASLLTRLGLGTALLCHHVPLPSVRHHRRICRTLALMECENGSNEW